MCTRGLGVGETGVGARFSSHPLFIFFAEATKNDEQIKKSHIAKMFLKTKLPKVAVVDLVSDARIELANLT